MAIVVMAAIGQQLMASQTMYFNISERRRRHRRRRRRLWWAKTKVSVQCGEGLSRQENLR
jgi:hypothetical protein